MNKEFVTYKQALTLKELGFDEMCFAWYNYGELLEFGNDHILDMYAGEDKKPVAPLKQQVFRWFREKHGLVIVIKPIADKRLELGYNLTKNGLIMGAYTTYEGAELACLKKLIAIANEK